MVLPVTLRIVGVSCRLSTSTIARSPAVNPVAKASDDHTLGVVINGNLTSAKLLKAQDYHVQWHGYAAEHTVCIEELHDIEAWLNKVLADVC